MINLKKKVSRLGGALRNHEVLVLPLSINNDFLSGNKQIFVNFIILKVSKKLAILLEKGQ